MIRRWQLTADGARFRNRFVRTEKFDLEEAEDRFAYATWTTQAPGGRIANLFGSSIGNQAGVSVHEKGGELFAFDESSLPHVLDPETLQTKGTSRMGAPDDVPDAVKRRRNRHD